MSDPARFWDRIAVRYSKRAVADEASYQEKLRTTQGYLRPNMKVLEFGCGTGSTALVHAAFVEHIRAIDISSKMVEIAKQKAEAAKVENVAFECASIDDLDESIEQFDAVLGFSILHLLDNWKEVIERVEKVLKPGGIFVTSTTCIGDSMKFLKPLAPIGKLLGLLPTLAFFTAAELSATMGNAGFEIEHEWQPGKNKAVFIVARKQA